MGTVTRHTDIDADPERVWGVLEDVSRLPELSESTTGVRVDGPLRSVGQEFEQTVELAGRTFTSTWSVLELTPAERLVIEGSVAPGTRYRMTEELEASEDADGAGTRLSLTMDYRLPFGPLGRLAGRLGVERRAIAEAEQVLAGVRRVAEGSSDRDSGDQ
jgi:uncharacterized protein YndB with AHSA1/START domain